MRTDERGRAERAVVDSGAAADAPTKDAHAEAAPDARAGLDGDAEAVALARPRRHQLRVCREHGLRREEAGGVARADLRLEEDAVDAGRAAAGRAVGVAASAAAREAGGRAPHAGAPKLNLQRARPRARPVFKPRLHNVAAMSWDSVQLLWSA